jgi:hypothetical protein
MNLTIDASESHARGEIYTVTAGGQTVSVLLTSPALRRADEWRLTVQSVIKALLWLEEVLQGHRGRFIAHGREKRHVVRGVYEYDGSMPGVTTVYYPYARRYFQGGGTYEDHILA